MCDPGFIEMEDGSCVYDFTSTVNPDGTPKVEKENWWEKVGDVIKDYGPVILIGAGTWWQNKQDKDAPNGGTPTPTPKPPAAPAKNNTMLYIGIGVAVLLVVAVLMLRRKGAAPVK